MGFAADADVSGPFSGRLIFVRHGETDWNVEGRLQGDRDVPLNAKGRDQAHAVGRFLRANYALDLARMNAAGRTFCSPLSRARETMTICRNELEFPGDAVLNADLREVSFGDWEGLTWPDIKVLHPIAYQARERDSWGYRPANGESFVDVVKRLAGFLGAISGDCFVVAHGGVARTLLALIGGVPTSAAFSATIHQGRALIFQAGGYEWRG